MHINIITHILSGVRCMMVAPTRPAHMISRHHNDKQQILQQFVKHAVAWHIKSQVGRGGRMRAILAAKRIIMRTWLAIGRNVLEGCAAACSKQNVFMHCVSMCRRCCAYLPANSGDYMPQMCQQLVHVICNATDRKLRSV